MSRIGILTFHSANNFGALLQAVSLQKTIIEHGGTECELISQSLFIRIIQLAHSKVSIRKLLLKAY